MDWSTTIEAAANLGEVVSTVTLVVVSVNSLKKMI